MSDIRAVEQDEPLSPQDLRVVVHEVGRIGLLDATLPPDRGQSGTVTLQGVDSDGDGVRDDLQRYVSLASSGSPKRPIGICFV